MLTRSTRPPTLFLLTFMGMELSYLYLLALLLHGPFYTVMIALILYPFAFLCNVLPPASLSRRISYLLEVALVSLAIVIVAGEHLLTTLAKGHPDAAGIVMRLGFCGLAWALGHTAPRDQVHFSTTAFRLQMGVLVVLMFSQAAGSALPAAVFFLLAPVALFLARWASSRSRGARVLRSPTAGHLLLSAACVTVPGTALILLLSPGVARAIVSWLGQIFSILSNWVEAQQKAASSPRGGFEFNLGCSMEPEEGLSLPTTVPSSPTSEEGLVISPVVIWLVVSVLFIATVALIAFALRRRQVRGHRYAKEPMRFQLRRVSFGAGRRLLRLFPWLFRELWMRLMLLIKILGRRREASQEPLTSVRALYRGVLRWAAEQGVARGRSQTPLEHLELLGQRFPDCRRDLKLVTDSYLVARYSQKPISLEELGMVKEAWMRTVSNRYRRQS